MDKFKYKSSDIIRTGEILLNDDFYPLFEYYLIFIRMSLESQDSLYVLSKGPSHMLFSIFSRILNDCYDDIDFLNNIKDNKVQEKVSYIIANFDKNKFNKILSSNFLTCTSLHDLVINNFKSYLTDENYNFPEISLIDDCLIYGRSINTVLYNIKDSIKKVIKNSNVDDSLYIKFLQKFYASFTVYVYKRGESPLLLSGNLELYFKVPEDLDKNAINKYKYKSSTFLSTLPISSNCSAFSVELSESVDEILNANCEHYVGVNTSIRSINMKTLFRNYNNSLIDCIKIKQNVCSKSPSNILIIPEIFVGENDFSVYQELYSQICSDNNVYAKKLLDNYFSNDSELFFYKGIQAINLYLSGLSLISYLNNLFDNDQINMIIENNINYEFILQNFKYNGFDSINNDDIRNILLFELSRSDITSSLLDNYLKLLSNKSKPIINNSYRSNINSVSEDEMIYHKVLVEKCVSDFSFLKNKDSYMMVNGAFPSLNAYQLTNGGKIISFSEILNNIYNQGNNINLNIILAYLIHLLDFNNSAFEPEKKSINNNIHYRMCNCYAQLFALISNYNDYYPSLRELESRWDVNSLESKTLVNRFIEKYLDNPSIYLFSELLCQIQSGYLTLDDFKFLMIEPQDLLEDDNAKDMCLNRQWKYLKRSVSFY